LNPGVYLVHKEVGQSSFDVVRGFKHEAWEDGQKKLALGHGGTLDPFAEGLLLVLAGQGTRLMELMHPLPKTYLARIAWGAETDSGDHLGLVAKAPDKIRAGERAVQDHFHRDDAVQTELPGAINHPHAAARDFLQQFIVAEPEHGGIARIRRQAKPAQAFQAQAEQTFIRQGRATFRTGCSAGSCHAIFRYLIKKQSRR